MIDVSGCIITADAMSCQKGIVKKISEKLADYVVSLKENQPLLHKEVEEYFAGAVKEASLYPI